MPNISDRTHGACPGVNSAVPHRSPFEGETVSSLGLGMDKMYPGSRESVFFGNVHFALDHGINLFDTAAIYGQGSNEDLLGRALADRRHQAFICTKFGHRPSQGGRPANVLADCELSLRNLRTDVIDLFLQHIPDADTPVEDTVGALMRLLDQGKIRHMGLSNATLETLRRAQAIYPQAAVQLEYSLWHRTPELEMLPFCRDRGIVFLAFWPLSAGFLAGRVRTPADLEKPEHRPLVVRGRLSPERLDRDLAALSVLEQIATSNGRTPAQVALAWMIGGAFRAVPVFGTQSPSHLAENIAAMAWSLPEGDRGLLNASFSNLDHR